MTYAVCFKCGEAKSGAFVACPSCKLMPRSDDDLMLSLMLTDNTLSNPNLARASQSIKAGHPPQFLDSEKDKFKPAVEEAKRLLGTAIHASQFSQPSRSKSAFKMFDSPGLALPFFAAVASLIIFWTLYIGQQRLVRQNEVLEYGVVFGLLSGVVLFAVMRAFDRSRTK